MVATTQQPVPAAESVLVYIETKTIKFLLLYCFTICAMIILLPFHPLCLTVRLTVFTVPSSRASSSLSPRTFSFFFIRFNDANTFLIHCYTSDSSYNFLQANFTSYSAQASLYKCAHAQKTFQPMIVRGVYGLNYGQERIKAMSSYLILTDV
jgi:hypothetical protein